MFKYDISFSVCNEKLHTDNNNYKKKKRITKIKLTSVFTII